MAPWRAKRTLIVYRHRSAWSAAAGPSRVFEPGQGPRMTGPIDFAEINRAALAGFPAVLARILPGGKRVGAEIVALNPRRADRHLGSFKINRYNGKWADFSTGDKGGDPIRRGLAGRGGPVARPDAWPRNARASPWLTAPISRPYRERKLQPRQQ